MPEEAQQRFRKRIGVDDVQVGMYCEDVFNEEGVLILSAQIPVSNAEQVEILKRLGVKYVDINLKKGNDVGTPKQKNAGRTTGRSASKKTEGTVPLVEELPKAKEVYRNTKQAARNALRAIPLGTAFPAGEIEAVVEEMVESVLRNRDALLSLSQIKGYDEYTYEHSVNVAILTCSLAHVMGYARDALKDACVGGLLHDIGKTWIPEHIVNKLGELTGEEYEIMKRHAEYGLEIVKDQRGISDLSKQMIIEHHERMNGKGYPRGLKGKQVHYFGLIAGVADVYDAMTSNRAHRAAVTPQQALATLYQGIDREFPRAVCEYFIKLLGIYPVGSFVRLFSGERGIVVKVNQDEILSPDVLVLFSADGRRLEQPMTYQLSRMVKEKGGERFAIEKSLDPGRSGVVVGDHLKETMAV